MQFFFCVTIIILAQSYPDVVDINAHMSRKGQCGPGKRAYGSRHFGNQPISFLNRQLSSDVSFHVLSRTKFTGRGEGPPGLYGDRVARERVQTRADALGARD